MKGVAFHNLHHAYLVIGDEEAVERAVLSLFEAAGAPLIGSPDFFRYREALLGVDDARKISEQAIRHAFTGKKVFLLTPEKITHEAQNALLKTFEEPIADTHFFLVLRDENLAFPTLRSRMQVIRFEGGQESAPRALDARKFLNLPLKERLAFSKKFADNEKNLSAFLDELLLELRSTGTPKSLEKVYRARLVSDDRGALPRLILEHLACSL